MQIFYEYIKYLGKSLFQIDRNLSYIKGNWPKGVNLTKDPLKEAFSKVKEDFENPLPFPRNVTEERFVDMRNKVTNMIKWW